MLNSLRYAIPKTLYFWLKTERARREEIRSFTQAVGRNIENKAILSATEDSQVHQILSKNKRVVLYQALSKKKDMYVM